MARLELPDIDTLLTEYLLLFGRAALFHDDIQPGESEWISKYAIKSSTYGQMRSRLNELETQSVRGQH